MTQVKSKTPTCPRRLSQEERAVWKKTVGLLRELDVLAEVDGAMLERYCRIRVEEWNLSVFIKKHGLSYEMEAKNGATYYAQRVEVTERNKVRTDLLKMEMQFAMTPASRKRLQVETAQKPEGVRTRTRRA